jgi:TPR repeat protein
MKKILFISCLFFATSTFAQWQQQLDQLSKDMIKIATDAQIAREKRQQEEKQRLAQEKMEREQRLAEEKAQAEQAEQYRIQKFSSNLEYYTDLVSNPNNPELGQYMDYITYQAKKSSYNFTSISTCISEEENNKVRKSLALFTNGTTKVNIGIGFWLNENNNTFRKILWCYCYENCESISTIKLPTILGSESLKITNGLTISENTIPNPTPKNFFNTSNYRGFDIESNINNSKTIEAYLHNANLSKICNSNESISEQIDWYQKAMDLGDKQSVLELAKIYENKLQDYAAALKFYELNYSQTKDSSIADNIARLYASKLKNKYKANEWFVITGYDNETIGKIYQYDFKNNVEAITFYKKAIEEDNKNLFFELAAIYNIGENGISKDFTEAKKWYLKAFQSNISTTRKQDMLYNIGLLYLNGSSGFPKDYQATIDYYIKALKLPDATDYKFFFMNEIAKLYSSTAYQLKDTNLNQDYNEARNWYLKVLELNLEAKDRTEIMMKLSKLYETGGENLKKDKSEAKYWYKKATSN